MLKVTLRGMRSSLLSLTPVLSALQITAFWGALSSLRALNLSISYHSLNICIDVHISNSILGIVTK